MDRNKRYLDEEKKKTKIKIGKVAARLFNRKNFLQVTLDEIAKAAKMSKGGTYHYFNTKQKILFFILNEHMDLVLGDLKEELRKIPATEEKLRFFINRHIKLYCENYNESRLILYEVQNLSPKYWRRIRSKTKEYTSILREIISVLIEDNNETSNDLKVYSYALLGMCNVTYWWYDPNGPVKPEELAEKIYTIFIRSLKTK